MMGIEKITLSKEIFDDKNKLKFIQILNEERELTSQELKRNLNIGEEVILKNLKELLEKDLIESHKIGSENYILKLTELGKNTIKHVEKDWNPSNEGTNRAEVFKILYDGKWHCADCELPGSQVAKDIQQIRINGFKFVGSPSFWGEKRYCDNCKRKTVHRKMKYPFPTDQETVSRKSMPSSFKTKVRKIYDHEDAFDGSSPSTTIEVDHRIPEVRWSVSEDYDFKNMSEEEIKKHFQVLSRKNNLLKSRKCESCVNKGIRPTFFGIEFYYKGNTQYDEDIGCDGCGWAYPQKWKKELNDLIKNHQVKFRF